MSNYNWLDYAGRQPTERFPVEAIGSEVWRELGSRIPDTLPTILEELTRLRASTASTTHLQQPKVFISHRQADQQRALEIKDLVVSAGFEYWLDVLEPALKMPANQTRTNVIDAFDVAVIIEMALLNCTHVLAVITPATEGSRWVPYEYGRVKDSSVYSLKAGCWVDSRVLKQSLAEYMWLGPITETDDEITAWLSYELHSWRQTHAARPASTPDTQSAVVDHSAEAKEQGRLIWEAMHAGSLDPVRIIKAFQLRKPDAGKC